MAHVQFVQLFQDALYGACQTTGLEARDGRVQAGVARWGSYLFVYIVLLGLCACGDGSGPEVEAASAVPAVEAVPARVGALPLEERLSGTVKARNQVAIRPEIEAPVTAVLVQSGATVSQGQPLVRLDGSRLQDQLRQAEASLRLAEGAAAEARARVAEVEAETVRSRRLAGDDLISDLDLETLEARLNAAQASAEQSAARVQQARATVQERRSDLARAVVRSPVGGRVGQRNAEVGMLVDPNTTLFVVGDLSRLRVEIPLTEAMLGYVEEGQPVRILPSGGEPLEAAMTRISPFLNESSFSTIGEIDLEAPEALLRPGTFVTVDVLYGESDRVTLVPTAAAWEDPRTGVLGVYVLGSAEGLAEPRAAASATAGGEKASLPPLGEEAYPLALRSVEVIAEGRGMIGVRGVEEGEWVVTQGQQLLSGGAEENLAARVRPASWKRVIDLQNLQREDLLRRFLAKQRRYAEERGAQPPSNREYLAPAIGDETGTADGADSGEGRSEGEP